MSESMGWPLLVNVIRGRKINHTFGKVRKYKDGSPKWHQGWDFEARVGTPVFAIGEGRVVLVRNRGAYGLQMCVSFRCQQQELFAFYAHLEVAYLREGVTVEMGEIIGAVGKSGNAENLGPADEHLHFEIRTRPEPRGGRRHGSAEPPPCVQDLSTPSADQLAPGDRPELVIVAELAHAVSSAAPGD